MRTGTHLHSAEPLRERLEQEFGDLTFDQLAVPFQCCAASIERAAETWFSEGPVVPAVVASAAVPGLLPPAEVGEEHYLDGGIVNSIPVGRAVELGATRIFVLQVGRVDRPLKAPRKPWEVARVSFEIARRHRFVREMAELPDGRHGARAAGRAARPKDDSPLGYRDTSAGGGTHRRGVRRQQGLPRGAPLMRHVVTVVLQRVVVAPLLIVRDGAAVDDAAAVAGRRRRRSRRSSRAGCARCGCSGSAWCT